MKLMTAGWKWGFVILVAVVMAFTAGHLMAGTKGEGDQTLVMPTNWTVMDVKFAGTGGNINLIIAKDPSTDLIHILKYDMGKGTTKPDRHIVITRAATEEVFK